LIFLIQIQNFIALQKLILLFILSANTLSFFAQDTLPVNYFRSPLDIPLYLSGSFGELRSNHFHSGIDIKTQGVEGHKIIAVADGYVSRIKVSPYGYGNAIYIDHPNGYTSVYAHLQKYSGKIATEVKKYQYANQTWEMDYYPPDTLLKVKKGQVIALSGNSGSSGGPHLHFEIRETLSEHPINPLLLGFDVKDNIAPHIRKMAVYPLNDISFVNQKNTKEILSVVGSGGNYRLASNTPISAIGTVGIGVDVIDQLNGVPNKNGVYEVKLFVNDSLIYYSEMNKFSFDESRALNSLIDYEYYLKTKNRFQKSFVAPNNKLSIYRRRTNNGNILIEDGKNYLIKYEITDTYKNKATLEFAISGNKAAASSNSVIKGTVDTLFSYSDSNYYENKMVRIAIPKNALYENLPFQFGEGKQLHSALTPTYQIHNDYTPLHLPITVGIKVGRISDEHRKKAVIVNIDANHRLYSRGGDWRNNYIETTSKTFGGFAVMLDTVAPIIKPVNIYPNKNMSNNSSVIFSISDNLSGIKTYNLYIDGKWVLLEFEPKKGVVYHDFDKLPNGEHTLKLEVTDGVENVGLLEMPFVR